MLVGQKLVQDWRTIQRSFVWYVHDFTPYHFTPPFLFYFCFVTGVTKTSWLFVVTYLFSLYMYITEITAENTIFVIANLQQAPLPATCFLPRASSFPVPHQEVSLGTRTVHQKISLLRASTQLVAWSWSCLTRTLLRAFVFACTWKMHEPGTHPGWKWNRLRGLLHRDQSQTHSDGMLKFIFWRKSNWTRTALVHVSTCMFYIQWFYIVCFMILLFITSYLYSIWNIATSCKRRICWSRLSRNVGTDVRSATCFCCHYILHITCTL